MTWALAEGREKALVILVQFRLIRNLGRCEGEGYE